MNRINWGLWAIGFGVGVVDLVVIYYAAKFLGVDFYGLVAIVAFIFVSTTQFTKENSE